MAIIDATVETAICSKCGLKYGRRRGYFAPSIAELHKGVGTIHICKTCLDDLFNKYLAECEEPMGAARQVCRKLDLYWNKNIYNSIIRETSTRTVMSCYMSKAKQAQYAGKSYDDTLREEEMLWHFMEERQAPPEPEPVAEEEPEVEEEVVSYNISKKTKLFWGSGYTDQMYYELEQRYKYWISEFPEGSEFDVGTKALIKQICSLELDINRDRMAGKPIDKAVNSLNTLLGSANLKPAQRKTDADAAMKFGYWSDWNLFSKNKIRIGKKRFLGELLVCFLFRNSTQMQRKFLKVNESQALPTRWLPNLAGTVKGTERASTAFFDHTPLCNVPASSEVFAIYRSPIVNSLKRSYRAEKSVFLAFSLSKKILCTLKTTLCAISGLF